MLEASEAGSSNNTILSEYNQTLMASIKHNFGDVGAGHPGELLGNEVLVISQLFEDGWISIIADQFELELGSGFGDAVVYFALGVFFLGHVGDVVLLGIPGHFDLLLELHRVNYKVNIDKSIYDQSRSIE